jgi:hypothetical protein
MTKSTSPVPVIKTIAQELLEVDISGRYSHNSNAQLSPRSKLAAAECAMEEGLENAAHGGQSGPNSARSANDPSAPHSGTVRRGIDLSSIYIFSSPILFNQILDMSLLLNTFYLAVFVANYMFVALQYKGFAAGVYFVLCLAPALMIYPVVVFCVRSTSLLHAISNLDIEVVGRVIDETEEMMTVTNEVIGDFCLKLREKRLGVEALKALFDEMDTDHSGSIDTREFKVGLASVGIHVSGLKYKRLFRAVDRDKSGLVEFNEFFQVLFPDEPVPEKWRPLKFERVKSLTDLNKDL